MQTMMTLDNSLHLFPLFLLMSTCLFHCLPNPAKARYPTCYAKCSGASLLRVANAGNRSNRTLFPRSSRSPRSMCLLVMVILSLKALTDSFLLHPGVQKLLAGLLPPSSHLSSLSLCQHIISHSASSVFRWNYYFCACV